jgi:WD40 repeat protein
MPTIDDENRPYTLFQGHSGPVYSAAVSPFGDFLLSSSSDSTSKARSVEIAAAAHGCSYSCCFVDLLQQQANSCNGSCSNLK